MTYRVRHIIDTARSAVFNMAADQYFMERCLLTNEVYVRTYTWSPSAISLGRMQRAGVQLDLCRVQADGIDWIRRPTGGRAVLHASDITYSCIFPKGISELGATVDETYRLITACLANAFETCGVAIDIQDSSDPLVKAGREAKLPCFLAPNKNEIMKYGRKIVGSAQYRNMGAVLQHGSIPFTDESFRLPHYLNMGIDARNEQAQLLAAKSMSLAQAVPELDLDAFVSALHDGFTNGLAAEHYEMALSDEEIAEINLLAKSEAFVRAWCKDE